MSEVGRSPASGSMARWDGVSMVDLGKGKKHGELSQGGSGGPGAPSAILPQGNPVSGSSSVSPEAIPIPDSPTFFVQLPSSRSLLVQLPFPLSSFYEYCTPSQAPVVDRGRFDHLPSGQMHQLRMRGGRNMKDSKRVSKTRLAPTEDEGDRRIMTGDDAMDTPVTVAGKGACRPRMWRKLRITQPGRRISDTAWTLSAWPLLRTRE